MFRGVGVGLKYFQALHTRWSFYAKALWNSLYLQVTKVCNYLLWEFLFVFVYS